MLKTSESLSELSEALSKAQGELKDPTVDSKNPHFRNEFASLEAVLKEIRPVFSKHALSFVQFPITDSGDHFLVTRLMHKSGQWMESSLKLILIKQDMQGVGAAVTYARRYSISSIAGIFSEKDDDGNSISQQDQKEMQKAKEFVLAQKNQKANELLKPQPQPIAQAAAPKNEAPATANQVQRIMLLMNERKVPINIIQEFMMENFGFVESKNLKVWQIADLERLILTYKSEEK